MITHLADFIERGALIDCPDKVALIDRDLRYSFADWDRLGRKVAGAILERKVALSAPIAVFLPKCANELIVDLGVLYAGNAFSNIDCAQPVQRLSHVMANMKPALAIAGAAQAGLAREAGIEPESILVLEEIWAGSATVEWMTLKTRRRDLIDTDPACIINTSGSTGIPKSCVLSHRGLIDFVLWFDNTFKLGRDEVVGSLSPFHFDGYIPGLFMALYRGATLNVIPGDLAMFPIKLAQYLAEHRISFIFWVPTVMINMASLDVLKNLPLPDLRTICFAGEVFPTRHCNYWIRHVPHAVFVNLYGPIEISVICTYYVVDRDFADNEPLPIGFPCHNTGILVLNEENRPCAEGEPGELCVTGSSLASGYWGDWEKTGKAFIQNPLNPHYPEIIYRTGDVVFRNDRGELMFVGRRDFQVKHQGNRIDLAEVEHFALLVPGIRNGCVLYNREQKQIVLAYEAEADVPPVTIRAELGRNLPKYMWPTVFHRLAELPRNPNGKIDRQQLSRDYCT